MKKKKLQLRLYKLNELLNSHQKILASTPLWTKHHLDIQRKVNTIKDFIAETYSAIECIRHYRTKKIHFDNSNSKSLESDFLGV
jgi:hypothetical protein